MERSHSGRVRLLGKQVGLNGSREFESPPLRHALCSAWLRSICVLGETPAVLCVYFPSLVLVSVSHMILNFIAVYYEFFTQERIKERGMY